MASPYVVDCDEYLFNKIFDHQFLEGITISAPGFYGPQGRILRLKTVDPLMNRKIESFSFNNMRITNFETANQFVRREYRKGWGELKI